MKKHLPPKLSGIDLLRPDPWTLDKAQNPAVVDYYGLAKLVIHPVTIINSYLLQVHTARLLTRVRFSRNALYFGRSIRQCPPGVWVANVWPSLRQSHINSQRPYPMAISSDGRKIVFSITPSPFLSLEQLLPASENRIRTIFPSVSSKHARKSAEYL